MPIRWVFTHDIQGTHRDDYFYTTDPSLAPSQIASWCHGAHDISPARPERLAETCVSCHATDSQQAAIGTRMWAEYRGAAEELEKAEAVAARAEEVPINTDDYRARLEEAKTYLREALPAAHSVREDLVAGFTARALSVAHEVESEIEDKLGEIRVRRFLLILFWFYVLLTILVLRGFQRRGVRPEPGVRAGSA